MTDPQRRPLRLVWWIIPVVILAWLPWGRNQAYLRDFYDYGLVIAGLGLLEQGQRPYVDFTTPIQAGYFGLNWLVEKAGGGTYLGLTRGAALLIIVMGAGLTALLARRWTGWAAGAVALAVTVASASQHTILWHNALGTGCLAGVVWATALAPVWRRADRAWHVLAALGLFLGGINKLNFQLVALAAACAWAVRAGLLRRAGWGAVAGTALGWVVVGLVLPVMAELAWTGASPATWWHNVVGLAAGPRAATMTQILSGKFLTVPIHHYYGPLLLPQVGLAGVILSLAALAGCWPARAADRRWNRDCLLLPLAVIFAAVAGAALLATNQDIAYLGLGAWLALVAGVWLGFAPAPRRGAFVGGLVLPALGLATVAGVSAWQGQRSQFGYSESPRSAYQRAEQAGPAYAYLAGVRLPPETVHTMGLVEKWLPRVESDGLRPVFYGPGTEWLNRFLPGLRQRGQPLWVHWGTSYGPREAQRLQQSLAANGRYRHVLTTLARDDWPEEIRQTLGQYFARDLLGPVTIRWTRREEVTTHLADSFKFLHECGGNVAGLALHVEERPVGPLPFDGDKIMLGVRGDEGWLLVSAPTYRLGGDAVLERAAAAGPGPLYADFKVIIHGAAPEEVRWSARVELPAGQPRITVPFKLDSMGRALQLRVAIPEEGLARLSAGYRNLQIPHAIESPDGPPRLRPGSPADAVLADDHAASLLGSSGWQPQRLTVRGGRPAVQGLELDPGGEVWFRSENMTGEIRGQLVCSTTGGARPLVRVVWYKGGRLQIMQQAAMEGDRPFAFHAWCAEPGGWFGILLDPGGGTASAQVRVTEAKIAP